MALSYALIRLLQNILQIVRLYKSFNSSILFYIAVNYTIMSSKTFLYFAFGSNLLQERIRLSNPSAILRDVACLQVNWDLHRVCLLVTRIIIKKVASFWASSKIICWLAPWGLYHYFQGYDLTFGCITGYNTWRGSPANLSKRDGATVWGTVWELGGEHQETLDW